MEKEPIRLEKTVGDYTVITPSTPTTAIETITTQNRDEVKGILGYWQIQELEIGFSARRKEIFCRHQIENSGWEELEPVTEKNIEQGNTFLASKDSK
jgi:hypothetical protein